MVTLESLRERWQTIDALYAQHLDATLALQDETAATLATRVADELQLGQAGVDRASAFLDDPVTIFRFFRKAHFDSAAALEMLYKTLKWRLSTSIDLVAPASINPLYSENPLFYFHPSLKDKFGRYAAILNLAYVVRPEDNSLESLKENVAFTLEVARRFLADMSKRDENNKHIQIVIILNLEDANFSNFEVEMLPFVVDLLKSHFPGMVGAIYILNYGWAYAGMWQISKRVLPKAALERILFCSKKELQVYFDEEHLLSEHGGSLAYKYKLSNNLVLTKYGRPSYFLRHRASTPSHSVGVSPAASRPLSRISSFESLRETFYSAPATPHTLSARSPTTSYTNLHGHKQRHPAWLDMTATTSTQQNGKLLASPVISPSQSQTRSPSLSSRRAFSQQSNGHADTSLDKAIEDDFASEEGQDHHPQWDQESLLSVESEDRDRALTALPGRNANGYSTNGDIPGSSLMTPTDSFRAASLAQLRTQLEANQPSSQHPIRNKSSGTLSPFNVNNPFYGYTVTRHLPGVPSSTVKLPHPRQYHARRRKRDLLRTLSYLFALRLLAIHRKLKSRLVISWRFIWAFLLHWGAVSRRWVQSDAGNLSDEDDDAGFSPKRKKRKGVRWASDDREEHVAPMLRFINPFVLLRVTPRWLIWLSALLFLRSRFFRVRARAVITILKAHARERWKTLAPG